MIHEDKDTYMSEPLDSKKKNLFNVAGLFGSKKPSLVEEPRKVSIEQQKHGSIEWTDIEDAAVSDFSEIAQRYKLHDVQIGQALQKGQLAQMAVEADYIFLILHFPLFVEAENRITTSQVGIFLGKDYLITTHDSSTESIRSLFQTYKDNNSLETRSSGRILFHIIEHLLKDVEELILGISLELDEIEDKVFDDKDSDAFQIGQLRQKIMRLRRTLATQKNALDELDAVIDKFTDEHLKRYYESNTNMSRKLWETVEEARETIEIYKDADFTTSTERTNEILAVLTLLFTLTIPATVIGTFYGMNILLPGGIEAGSWTFLGEYTALKIVLGVSTILALLMYLYFRSKKWF